MKNSTAIMNKMIKEKLINTIIKHLENEQQQAINAANNAHHAAVNDQSVAETQYDTLAIEASYLAEGQSKRVQEYQRAIQAYQQLTITVSTPNSSISLGTLVQLFKDKNCQHWFFIGPFSGGFRCKIANQQITVISPQSPMAIALLGKKQDDDIEISLGNEKLCDYIYAVK